MLLILTRIRENIPIILMGETGCGKTSLIKKLFEIMINKSTFKMKILSFNEEILDEDIVDFINNIKIDAKKLEEEEQKKKEKYELRGIFYNKNKIWVFLDQINRCKSTALITELICKHSIFGKKLPESIEFIAACNPYRFKEKKLKDINDKELAYNVNPFPSSLYNFVLNFSS
jgi:energy-coupling factor transporter ATP-binding protein EcfA2